MIESVKPGGLIAISILEINGRIAKETIQKVLRECKELYKVDEEVLDCGQCNLVSIPLRALEGCGKMHPVMHP